MQLVWLETLHSPPTPLVHSDAVHGIILQLLTSVRISPITSGIAREQPHGTFLKFSERRTAKVNIAIPFSRPHLHSKTWPKRRCPIESPTSQSHNTTIPTPYNYYLLPTPTVFPLLPSPSSFLLPLPLSRETRRLNSLLDTCCEWKLHSSAYHRGETIWVLIPPLSRYRIFHVSSAR